MWDLSFVHITCRMFTHSVSGNIQWFIQGNSSYLEKHKLHIFFLDPKINFLKRFISTDLEVSTSRISQCWYMKHVLIPSYQREEEGNPRCGVVINVSIPIYVKLCFNIKINQSCSLIGNKLPVISLWHFLALDFFLPNFSFLKEFCFYFAHISS